VKLGLRSVAEAEATHKGLQHLADRLEVHTLGVDRDVACLALLSVLRDHLAAMPMYNAVGPDLPLADLSDRMLETLRSMVAGWARFERTVRPGAAR
jgi:hypothetical protein